MIKNNTNPDTPQAGKRKKEKTLANQNKGRKEEGEEKKKLMILLGQC